VILSKFHIQDSQISGAAETNLAARVTWRRELCSQVKLILTFEAEGGWHNRH
jgi:hypothetical protein